MQALDERENVLLGVSVAVIEGLLLQPTLYWKNARAQGLPLTLSPRILYRGIGASLTNEAGQMSIQFGVTGLLKALIQDGSGGTDVSSQWLSIGAAAGGGMVAAVFATPVELVMIQQQRFGGGVAATPLRVMRRFGPGSAGLFRGLGPAVSRDAVYVGGMLGVTPMVQEQLERKHGQSSEVASLIASAVGGVAGGMLSHPFDTIKTCMQGDIERKMYGGFASTVRALVAEGGYSRLMHGAMWRTINITATVYIANECCNRLPQFITRLSRGDGRDRT